jgi:hypothetical protein
MNPLTPILESATPDLAYGWTLSTRLVAEGYGVKPETIRSHKANNADEILEGHHWITGAHNHTYWTRAGVLRLGMFIKSDQAITFRNAAEAYLMQPVENINAPTNAPISPELDLLASAIADEVLSEQLQNRVNFHLEKKLRHRQTVEAALGKLGLPMPRDWPIASLAPRSTAIAPN